MTLVCGAPCSGKTTLAQRLASTEGGQVLDFDAIAVELGSPHPWEHSPSIREQAEVTMRMRMRRLALDCGANTYVIRSLPEPARREAVAERLSAARVWVLDPGLDVCLARAQADARPRGTAQAIRAWYGRYEPAEVDQPGPDARPIVTSRATSRVW